MLEKSNELLEKSKREIEENKKQLIKETKKLSETNAESDKIYLRTTELNNNILEAYKKLKLTQKINREVQKINIFINVKHNIYSNAFRIHLPCNILYIVYRHERIQNPRI